MNREIVVSLKARLRVINHSERPTYVKLVIVSVDSDWVPAANVSDIEVEVDRFMPGGGAKAGNPFNLDGGEINDDLLIRAMIPFGVPDIEKGFGYLGLLSHMTLELGAEQAGRNTIALYIKCDIAGIRQSIEDDLVTRVQHSAPDGDIPRQFREALRQYWNVGAKEEEL